MTVNICDKLAPFGYMKHKCQFVQTLGEGGNGIVHLVRYNGRLACLKIGKGGKEQIDRFTYEGFVMMEVDGAGGTPQVIMIASDMPALLMTYCPYPSLLDILEEGKVVSVYQAFYVIKAVTIAVYELHSAGFSHNDFKLDNVLIDLHGLQAHIIDLGMACPVGSSLPGFLNYFQGHTVDDHKYPCHYDLGLYLGGPAMSHCDIYSLGILMRMVLETVDQFDHKLYSLCKQMLRPKVSARPTLSQVLNLLEAMEDDVIYQA